MRSQWKATDIIALSDVELTELLQPVLPGQQVLHSELTSGGLSNTNIKIDVSGQEAPLLVRIYSREGAPAAKEFALNKLTHPKVASPEFFFQAETNAITGHPYAIMEWIDGQRLEVVAPELEDLTAMSRSVGRAMADIHSFKFAHTGFLRNDLTPVEPLDMSASGLRAYINQCLSSETIRNRIEEKLVKQLIKFVEREGDLLAEWNTEACLTHCDFGGSNILVRHTKTRDWEVVAILDWEFAFSGAPYFDFGNLLRRPLGELNGFAEGVATGYCEFGGTLPQQWRKISKLGDLTAWVEFLTRKNPGEALISDAKAVIQRTISEWETL